MDKNGKDFAQGLKLHQGGELARAEQIYRRVLRIDPFHTDALNLLGVIEHQRGRHAAAVEYIGKALSIDSKNALYYHNLGAAYEALGRTDDAIDSYQRGVQLNPNSAQAQFTLGMVLLCQKNALGAESRFQQAIRLKPDFAEAHFGLGNSLQAQYRWDAAVIAFQEAIRLKPNHAEAHHNLGIALHHVNYFEQAVTAYRTALRLRPDFSEAHLNLGTTLQALGRLEDAGASFDHFLTLRPDSAAAHNNRGILAQVQGELDVAQVHFRQALELQPAYFEARYNLGTLCELRGDFAEAETSYRQALELNPNSVETHNNLGNVLNQFGQTDAAIACYEEALRLSPRFSTAHINLGNVRLAQNRLREAIGAYVAALDIRPDCVEALCNMGTALNSLGQTEKAAAAYRLAIRIRPSYLPPYNNLGNLLNSLGRTSEAETCYRAVLSVSADNASAHNNLGVALNTLGRVEEAAACFERAIQLDPEYADAHGNLSTVLQLQGRLGEAVESYRRTLDLDPTPSMGIACITMLPPVYESAADVAEWRESFLKNVRRLLEDDITLDPTCETLPVNFYLPYQGQNDREVQEMFGELYSSSMPEEPARKAARPRQDGRIRVGILSKFLKSHTIGHFTQGIVAKLSREKFHVTVFSVGQHQDEIADFIRAEADAYVVLSDQISASRETIANAELDVLFYPDVGMDPVSYTLAFSRLAPVQCVTWGHPVTTGIPNIDYFLSSALLEGEQADAHYSEELVRLNTLPTYYYRPRLTSPKNDRGAFGLPAQGNIYLCPQSLFKFHPDFDAVVKGILQRDPIGHLALIEAPHRHWNELLQSRFQRTLGDAAERVHFLKRQDHADFLNLIALADVMLDPLHFGGGNTSYQALALGTPVVTLPSEFLRGRVTAGCYRKMNLTSCIAANESEYIALACRLAQDKMFRAQVSADILAASSALFEDLAAVRELEQFFQRAVETARGNIGRAA